MRYSAEHKETVQKRMLPPNSRSIEEIAAEEGISAGKAITVKGEGTVPCTSDRPGPPSRSEAAGI